MCKSRLPITENWGDGDNDGVAASEPMDMRSVGVTTSTSASRSVPAARTTTTVPPPAAALWTPARPLSRSSLPSPSSRQTWTSVGSSDAVNTTRCSSATTTLRTCKVSGVAVLPSITRHRADSRSSTVTSRSPVHVGVPGTNSTQCLSVWRATSVVAPVSGSTSRNTTVRWSRLCTVITGFDRGAHAARARYSKASRSQATSTRLPSSPRMAKETSALTVPAAG